MTYWPDKVKCYVCIFIDSCVDVAQSCTMLYYAMKLNLNSCAPSDFFTLFIILVIIVLTESLV